MIQFKIYTISSDGLLEEISIYDGFLSSYDSMEEAIQAIHRNGDRFIDYTILPVVTI